MEDVNKKNKILKFVDCCVKGTQDGIKNFVEDVLKDKNPIYYVFIGINEKLNKEYLSNGKSKNFIVAECERYLSEEDRNFKYFISSVVDLCITNMDWKELYAKDPQEIAKIYSAQYIVKYNSILSDEEHGVLQNHLTAILTCAIETIREEYKNAKKQDLELLQNIALDIEHLDIEVKDLRSDVDDLQGDMVDIKETISLGIQGNEEGSIAHNFSKNQTPIFGRENELVELKKAFSESKIVFLSGIGGIGKSVLAREYAANQPYETIVEVWGDSLKQDILSIKIDGWNEALAFKGISEDDPRYLEMKADKLANLVKGHKVLLIIHDFDTQELAGMDKLKRIACDTLITSRCTWRGYKEVKLDPRGLSEKASIQLFCYHSGMDETEEGIKELVSYLEYHPLLIELVAKQMSFSEDYKTTPKEMLEELSAEGVKEHKYEKFQYSKDQMDIETGDVYAHLSNIFAAVLRKGNLDDRELEVLRYMTLVGNMGMDRETFGEWAEFKKEEFPILDGLVRKGWLICENGIYRMHMAICEAIYRLEEIQPTVENAEIFLIHFCMRDINKISTYEERKKLFAIAETVWKHLKEEESQEYARVVGRIGYFLWHDSRYRDITLEINEKVLEIRIKVLGEEHVDTANAYNNAGYMYDELGYRKKGLEYKEKALEICCKVLGEEHAYTATAYNNVGYSYEQLGNREKGLEYEEKALAIRLKVLGEEHADTASSYNNLGNLYEELGDRKKGLEYKEKALEICLKVLGEEHADTATSYNNMGLSYEKLGDRQKGLEYLEKALEIRLKVLGKEHEDTAFSYRDVGFLYWKLGNKKRGVKYMEKTLSIYRNLLGENDPEVTSLYKVLASWYLELGNIEKVIEYMEKSEK